jgi:hypothetical protein
MALKVIGSGFGRTGTMSTKPALEQLGFGPCHHMVEVMQNPPQLAFWKAHLDGAEVDWDDAFAGYQSQVDFPGAAVWQELSVAFPEAKVIQTERPAVEWWASYAGTIGKFFAVPESLPLPPPIAAVGETMDTLLVQRLMGGFNKESTIAAYRLNNEKVRGNDPGGASAGPHALRRMGADLRFPPRPASAFPRTHARDELWAHFGGEPAAA